MGKTRSAFSLIELLVALGVVSVLVVLASTGVSRALNAGRAAKCLGNLRSMGLASTLFSGDNNGRLPQSTHQGPSVAWQYVLPGYLDNDRRIFRSPLAADRKDPYSYAINDLLTAKPYGARDLDFSRRQSIETPARTMLFSLVTKDYAGSDHFHFANSDEGGSSPTAFAFQVMTEVYDKSGHYLFVDGHAERVPWQTLKSELARPGTCFLRPDGQSNL